MDSAEHTHTHCLMALCPGLLGWAGTIIVRPICILLKQETMSGSGISWAICRSAFGSRQITTPAPHHSDIYRPDALPAAHPTASKLNVESKFVKAGSVEVTKRSCRYIVVVVLLQAVLVPSRWYNRLRRQSLIGRCLAREWDPSLNLPATMPWSAHLITFLVIYYLLLLDIMWLDARLRVSPVFAVQFRQNENKLYS